MFLMRNARVFCAGVHRSGCAGTASQPLANYCRPALPQNSVRPHALHDADIVVWRTFARGYARFARGRAQPIRCAPCVRRLGANRRLLRCGIRNAAQPMLECFVTGLLAWRGGQPGQVGNEAATAVFRQCRGSGSSPSAFFFRSSFSPSQSLSLAECVVAASPVLACSVFVPLHPFSAFVMALRACESRARKPCAGGRAKCSKAIRRRRPGAPVDRAPGAFRFIGTRGRC